MFSRKILNKKLNLIFFYLGKILNLQRLPAGKTLTAQLLGRASGNEVVVSRKPAVRALVRRLLLRH